MQCRPPAASLAWERAQQQGLLVVKPPPPPTPPPSPLPHHFLLQEGRAARGHPPGGDSGRVGGSKWRVSARPGEGPGPQLAWLHCRI